MTRLSSELVLKNNNNASGDASSIITLHLNYKSLSDVSCLAEFKNLEKLDLSFNNLTSLEGLRSCVNLKWLSVVENKLESLDGVQGLVKLTVLNAGKNKLKSMDQVCSLASLRALILNGETPYMITCLPVTTSFSKVELGQNEIVSICKLDQMKELNTLVLSKNPIRKIGDALVKVKSIRKLSLSYCQLQGIDSSLKSCIELREVRLNHNEIKSLPDELMHNSKLQNLDLGNNVITRWSELKIKKALPKLKIFNARPVDKDSKNEKGDNVDGIHDFPVDHEGQNLIYSSKEKKSRPKETKKDHPIVTVDPDVENKSTKKKRRKDEKPLHKGLAADENANQIEKKLKKKQKNEEQSELDLIDDPEASFADLFNIGDAENLSHGEMKALDKAPRDVKPMSGAVTSFSKRKSAKKNTESLLYPSLEIGMGGPSTWGDD
ncbi:hypothetical protein RIF29_27499 [Crotalaria pallida]|uniref:Leucine-rich repeat protein n=1 Tax=Crotalaria pallida TaxID=3830 RepID=A0AAN9EP67_CROPI